MSHEVIGKARTYDNKAVELWSDGMVTGPFGFRIKGAGSAKSKYEQKKNIEAGWIVLGEASVYDLDEISRLVDAARKAVRQKSHQNALEYTRQYFAGVRFQKAGKIYKKRRLY